MLDREQDRPHGEHEGQVAHKAPNHGLHQVLGPLLAEGEDVLQFLYHTAASFPTFHWALR